MANGFSHADASRRRVTICPVGNWDLGGQRLNDVDPFAPVPRDSLDWRQPDAHY